MTRLFYHLSVLFVVCSLAGGLSAIGQHEDIGVSQPLDCSVSIHTMANADTDRFTRALRTADMDTGCQDTTTKMEDITWQGGTCPPGAEACCRHPSVLLRG